MYARVEVADLSSRDNAICSRDLGLFPGLLGTGSRFAAVVLDRRDAPWVVHDALYALVEHVHLPLTTTSMTGFRRVSELPRTQPVCIMVRVAPDGTGSVAADVAANVQAPLN